MLFLLKYPYSSKKRFGQKASPAYLCIPVKNICGIIFIEIEYLKKALKP